MCLKSFLEVCFYTTIFFDCKQEAAFLLRVPVHGGRRQSSPRRSPTFLSAAGPSPFCLAAGERAGLPVPPGAHQGSRDLARWNQCSVAKLVGAERQPEGNQWRRYCSKGVGILKRISCSVTARRSYYRSFLPAASIQSTSKPLAFHTDGSEVLIYATSQMFGRTLFLLSCI